jgi:hypothetical protein
MPCSRPLLRQPRPPPLPAAAQPGAAIDMITAYECSLLEWQWHWFLMCHHPLDFAVWPAPAATPPPKAGAQALLRLGLPSGSPLEGQGASCYLSATGGTVSLLNARHHSGSPHGGVPSHHDGRPPAQHGQLPGPSIASAYVGLSILQLWGDSLDKIPRRSRGGEPSELSAVAATPGGRRVHQRRTLPPPPPPWDEDAVLPPPHWLVSIDAALPQGRPCGQAATGEQRLAAVRDCLCRTDHLEMALAVASLAAIRPGDAGHLAQLWACAALGRSPGS